MPPPGTDGTATVDKGRPAWLKVVVGVALVLIVVGVGVSLFKAVKGTGGGSETPEGAVTQLAASVNDNDVLGALTTVDPKEITSLGEVWTKTQAKAEAIGLTKTVPGKNTKFEIADLDLSATNVTDDLAKVKVRSGKVSASYSGDGSLYVGGTFPDKTEKAMYNLKDINTDYRFVMVVRRDGRWYVSLLYTLAEEARIGLNNSSSSDATLGWGKGFELKAPKGNKAATAGERAGADSPSAAVKGLVGSVNDTEAEKILTYFSPAQFGAAYDYFDTFVTEGVQEQFAQSQKDYKWSVDDLKLSEEDLSGGRKKVIVSGGTVSWKDHDRSGTVEWDADCYTYTQEGREKQHHCKSEWPALAKAFPSSPFLVTREDNGKWFVDPIDTACQYAITMLDNIDDNEVKGLLAAATVGEPTPAAVGTETTFGLSDGVVSALYTYEVKKGQLYSVQATDSVEPVSVSVRGAPMNGYSGSSGTVAFYAKSDGKVVVQVYRRPKEDTFGQASQATLQFQQLDVQSLPSLSTGESATVKLGGDQGGAVLHLKPATKSKFGVKDGSGNGSGSGYSYSIVSSDGSSAYDTLESGKDYVAVVYAYDRGAPGEVKANLDPVPTYLPSGDQYPVRLERGRSTSESLESYSSSSSSSGGVRNFYVVGDGSSWRVGVTSASFSMTMVAYEDSSRLDSDSGYASSSSPVVVDFTVPKGQVAVISVSSSSSSSSSFTIVAQ